MKGSFVDFARKRVTTYEFASKGLKKSDLDSVLEAGRWAPSFQNSQPWRFIVVTKKALIAEIMRSVYYGPFHNDPPVLVALVTLAGADRNRFRGIRKGNVGFVESLLSLSMPALNMCYAAMDLGIDSALLTPEHDPVAKLLGLEGGEFVPLLVGLGYAKKGGFSKDKSRKTLDETVSYVK